MHNLKELLQQRQKTEAKPRNERNEIIDKFLLKLNPPRVQAGYKPFTYPRVAKILTGLSDQQLYMLFKECERGKSFGALLTYKLKHK